jgi:hypothetical protein
MARADWRRIKKEAVHLTAAQQMALQLEEDSRRKNALRAIKSARAGLIEAEAEKQRMLKVQQTQRQMDERELALEIAEAKGNEELDEVKTMNTEVIAARARTIRDRQLAANRIKAEQERAQEAEDARWLEEGRRRAVAIYAERERALSEQRHRGGAVIVAQMEERKRNARLEAERREREKEEMMRANLAAREEERLVLEERHKRSKEFLQECLAANVIQLRRKQREKERELEEAQMMVEFQAEKAAREEAYEQQVAAVKAAKEREVVELRKKQQRAIDTKAEVDALRARRCEEEKERIARQKELDDLKRVWELKAIQDQDRAASVALKQRRLVEMAMIEKAEFDRVSSAQREAREKDRRREEKRQRTNAVYRQELKDEIARKTEEKRIQPIINLDEQKHLEEINDDYMQRLERIRQMKLDNMREEGVPDKYLADLANMRFALR